MKRISATLLLVGVGLSLASADAPRSTLMREEPGRKTEELAGSATDLAPQGIGWSDLVATRDINQQIAALPWLSPEAKDVRVGTYRGRVTLTGTVVSREEKQRIEDLARRQAGATNVVSELVVKQNGRS